MHARSEDPIKPYNRGGEVFSLQSTYGLLDIDMNYSAKWIEPMKVIAIGECSNSKSYQRNAIVLVLDPSFQRMSKSLCGRQSST